MKARELAALGAFGALIVGAVAVASADTPTLQVAIDPAHGTPYIDFMKAEAHAFTAATGVKVNLIVPGDERTQINVWAAAGTLPDVVDVVSNLGLDYVRQGVFLDLRPFIQADPSMSLSRYNPVAVQAFTLPGYLPFGKPGMVYAIPWSLFDFVGLVNMDLLAQDALADPTTLGTGWTWDTFANYAKKATQKDGSGKIVQEGSRISSSLYRFDAWLRNGGGSVFGRDFDPQKVTMDTPQNRQTLDFFVNLLKAGVVSTHNYWSGGQALMMWSGQSNESKHSFAEKYVAFPYGPTGERGSEFDITGTAISATTKVPKLAWEWIKWLWGSEEQVKGFINATYRTPAMTSLNSYFVLNNPNKIPNSRSLIDASAYPGTGLRPDVRDIHSADIISSWLGQALSLKAVPSQALASAQKQAQAILNAAFGEGSAQDLHPVEHLNWGGSAWKSEDIHMLATGGAKLSGDTLTVTGAGSDIYGSQDSFHYVHEQVSGDFTAIVQLHHAPTTNAWGKAGIMVRQSADPGAPNAAIEGSGSSGVAFQYRVSQGGSSKAIHGPKWDNASPVWLKLVRKGDQITGYQSTDQKTWTKVGEIAIAFKDPVLVGPAVTSHAYGIPGDGVFSTWSLKQG